MPAQERGERRVADLLAAAEELLISEGYEATTMSAIAQRAGASIGSLYQFFPNKESIGNALLAKYLEELTNRLERWKSDLPAAPREFGRELVAMVVDYMADNPAGGVLAETPAFVPVSHGMRNLERFAASVRDLLSAYGAHVKPAELGSISFAACFMIRAAVQGSRMSDRRKAAALRKELQEALGGYLDLRLGSISG